MSYQGPNPEVIRNMFKRVAPAYDRANTVLSAGIHHVWRRKLVKMANVQSGQLILDCATGTGDLAIEFKKAVGPQGKVIGTDFCAEMMTTAPAKANSQGLHIDYQVADVMNLPFADNSFDRVSISFGIRNVQDPLKALREMARVTKPGGQVLILEFGQMTTPVIKDLYGFFSERLLPVVGGWVSGEKEAYQYLQKSSAKFPSGPDFQDWMKQTGAFSSTAFTPISLGIAYIYQGLK